MINNISILALIDRFKRVCYNQLYDVNFKKLNKEFVMDIITWRSEYQIGIKSVDTQHKYLLELANKLIESKSKKEMIKNVMLLKKFTREHYRDEETLMRDCKYPDYLTHKKEHDLLLDKMDGFCEKMNKDDLSNDEIKGFICMWLLDHVFGKDEEFGKFLHLFNQG